MKHDIVDIDERDKNHLEYEAVRRALVDAMLRSRDGRLRTPGRTTLSSLEERWTNDVARILVGNGIDQGVPNAAKDRTGMRFVRVVRTRLGSILGQDRVKFNLCDAAAKEFQYVPVASGPHGDVRGLLESGCTGKSDSSSTTDGSTSS